MGRNARSFGVSPLSQLKGARAKKAKETVNKDIPALLQGSPRAKKGVESSELIVNPQPASDAKNGGKAFSRSDEISATENDESTDLGPNVLTANPIQQSSKPTVRLQLSDTLDAAANLMKSSKFTKGRSARVAILNMASPLRPGGGFLNGARAQEESLCMRTTLYPALNERFYRLPEVSVIWTSDVLVFRASDAELTDLPKNERFFVDVVTSAMLRFPDVEEDESGQKRYANPKDRERAEAKMRAVMRVVQSKGITKLVLGAWGCGAYANPVNELAPIWRKVLLGAERSSQKSRSKRGLLDDEAWNGMQIVFAINEEKMARSFAEAFGEELQLELLGDIEDVAENEDRHDGHPAPENEAADKIAQLESQIESARSDLLKERLKTIVEKLKTSEEL